jgi:lysophospholipase L1-like esterase
VHRLAWVLLVALIAGCGSDPIPPASSPEPVTLTPPRQPGVDYVAIIGDSYTSGSAEGGVGLAGWPALVTTQLKNQGITIVPRVGAVQNSRYVVGGIRRARAFADEVGTVVGPQDRLVVLFGSRNDAYKQAPPTFADELNAAVQRTLAKAKEQAPKATILVIGPALTTWADDDPSPPILLVRDTLKAQAEASGAVFVDPVAEQWFVGQPDLIGSDRMNPTDAGHVYMADKIAPIIAQLLRPPRVGP